MILDWTDYFVGLTGELEGAPYQLRRTGYTTIPEPRTRPLRREREVKSDARRRTHEVMTTMENGGGVAEPVREGGLPKSFKDAVVEGEGVNGGGEGEVNGAEESVLPKSFAEVVVEGAAEGAEGGVNGHEHTEAGDGDGKSDGEVNGDKKSSGETNGDKKGQRNGDTKGRREQADNHTNDDGGKSYAAAVSTIPHLHPQPTN